jgi:hypothetical protein
MFQYLCSMKIIFQNLIKLLNQLTKIIKSFTSRTLICYAGNSLQWLNWLVNVHM